jgi:hypothetical protein
MAAADTSTGAAHDPAYQFPCGQRALETVWSCAAEALRSGLICGTGAQRPGHQPGSAAADGWQHAADQQCRRRQRLRVELQRKRRLN